MSGRGAVPLALMLWLGIVAGRSLAIEAGGAAAALAPIALVLATLAALAAWQAGPRFAPWLVTLAALAAGTGRGALHAQELGEARAVFAAGGFHRLRATVDEPPSGAPASVRAVLRIERSEPGLRAGTRVRLRMPEAPVVAWGDRVDVLAELIAPTPRRNPGGYDPIASADAGRIAAGGRAVTVTRLGTTAWGGFASSTVVRGRRAVERVLAARLSPEARELVLPLVTGDRGELPAEVDADFRASGLVHLLALSGLHVSALAAVARAVAASAGGGVGARAVVGMLAALFYLSFAGPLPSLARAAVSECWAGVACLARRPVDPLQALAVSALGLLAIAPGWALDLGFQLSCAASLGLVLAAEWSAGLPDRLRAAAAPLLASLAAQALCAPILLTRTHALSWPALAANFVAVPLCGALLAAAWLAVVADLTVPGSGAWLFGACEALSRALVHLTHVAAGWPHALLSAGHEPGVVALALGGAVLLAAGARMPRTLDSRSRRTPAAGEAVLGAGAFACVLAVALAASARELRPPPGVVWIVALDVGQGDATAIGTPRGWWLVDAGPRLEAYDAGERVVNPFLRWAAIRRLEAVVITHDDADHAGGAEAVMRRVSARRRIRPASAQPAPGFAVAAAGETLTTDPIAVVRWPPARAGEVSTRSTNSGALVLELSLGAVRVWLPSDVDSVVERELPPGGPIDLVKVGHHGSASSSGASWIAAAAPRVAWVSAGARNRYGHPSPQVVARFRRLGTRVDRTDREGALWYEVSSHRLRRLDWRGPASARREPPARTVAPPCRAPRPRTRFRRALGISHPRGLRIGPGR